MKVSIKRILSITISMILFIGCLVVFTYLIAPTYDEINSKRATVSSLVGLVNDYQKSLDRVNQLQSKYQDVVQSQKIISLILPLRQNTAEIVNQINNLAAVNHLKMDSLAVQLQPIKPSSNASISKGIGSLRLSFHLTGDYQDFHSYLGNLESNVYLVDLNLLKIDNPSGSSLLRGGESSNLSYTLTADSYYQSN